MTQQDPTRRHRLFEGFLILTLCSTLWAWSRESGKTLREEAQVQAHVEAGEALLKEQHFAQAAGEFREALAKRSHDTSILIRAAEALTRSGQREAGLSLLEQAYLEDPRIMGDHESRILAWMGNAPPEGIVAPPVETPFPTAPSVDRLPGADSGAVPSVDRLAGADSGAAPSVWRSAE